MVILCDGGMEEYCDGLRVVVCKEDEALCFVSM